MAKKYHEDHFSPRVADLMSALTLIFLFISVVYMLQVNKEKERIEMIAKDFKNTKYEIYTDLNEEFKDDLKKWNAYIDRDTLSITFKEPDVFFDVGSSNINQKFKDILDDFFPRYVEILFTKYNKEIKEQDKIKINILGIEEIIGVTESRYEFYKKLFTNFE